MEITGFDIKVTASKKLCCDRCNKPLFGKDGFFQINVYNRLDYLGNKKLNICPVCWEEMKKKNLSKDYLKKRFQYLLKTNALRKLK